jgi:hypothetical protein
MAPILPDVRVRAVKPYHYLVGHSCGNGYRQREIADVFGSVDLKCKGEVYFCKWLPFFSLKGWNNIAQGNALGCCLFSLFSL